MARTRGGGEVSVIVTDCTRREVKRVESDIKVVAGNEWFKQAAMGYSSDGWPVKTEDWMRSGLQPCVVFLSSTRYSTNNNNN